MEKAKENKFYITTSIAYTNAPPHIGFALELIQADVLARYNRLQQKDVYFLTGTDEHGTKVEEAAKKDNLLPKQFACLLYTSPSPRDRQKSRMPSSA